jgi:hypothetical protein
VNAFDYWILYIHKTRKDGASVLLIPRCRDRDPGGPPLFYLIKRTFCSDRMSATKNKPSNYGACPDQGDYLDLVFKSFATELRNVSRSWAVAIRPSSKSSEHVSGQHDSSRSGR